MRLLNPISGVFCAFVFGSKLLYLLSTKTYAELESTKDSNDFIGMTRYLNLEFDYKFSIVWCLVYFLLLSIWLWAFVKRKETVKIWIASITLLSALIMNITDNVEHSIYISNVVVGTEILE